MRHILAPILLLVLLFPTLALGEEISGIFTCKIKDITILEMEEGLPKTYKGFEGRSKIGDNMQFKYQFEFPKYFSFERIGEKLNWREILRITDQIKHKDELMRELSPGYYFSEDSHVGLSSDNIDVKDSRGGELSLIRYYKNDWHGVLVRDDAYAGANIISLDCRNPGNSLDEILKDLRNNGY